MVYMRGGRLIVARVKQPSHLRGLLGHRRMSPPDLDARYLVMAAILVLSLVTWSALPVHGGSEEGERNRYRAEFFSLQRGVSPSSVGTIYHNEEVYEATASEAADLYAERMMALKEAAEAYEQARTKGNKGGSSTTSSNGPVLSAGFFSLQEWLEVRSGNPTVACSDLSANAHYTVAVPVGDEQYVGVAFSDIATYPGAVAWINDAISGGRTYSSAVYYGGVSDFMCTEFPITAGGIALMNQPTVAGGFVIGTDA